MYDSNIKLLKSFIPSLDNQCKEVKDVTSLMVAPIHGHVNLDGSPNLVAILQLVNKLDGIITDHDVVSFKLCFVTSLYLCRIKSK